VQTIIKKGKAPVDPECSLKSSCHVYVEDDDIYNVMLNQTNIEFNNNKYYAIQLLEDDNAKHFHVWTRWGRVGKKGHSSTFACGSDLDKAKSIFEQKFSDKTRNNWSDRENFEKVRGKYDLVAIDYSGNSPSQTSSSAASSQQQSKLEKSIQSLLELIGNVQKMEEVVMEMKYDIKKSPLGKLSKEQIQAGYQAVRDILDCINNNDTGKNLVQACNRFYTRIPHNFGMRTPPVIRTKAEAKMKLDLLNTLADIEVALKTINDKSQDEDPMYKLYKSLKCEIKSMDKNNDTYKIIDKYLQITHAKTHNGYTMSILDIYELDKDKEEENFKDSDNRMLLWHGSRLANWIGILTKGLRIAPPDAPSTGYMFGKGIYFADISSKSANYCFATRSNDVGLVLLCDVSLGKSRELLAADYDADQLPVGYHSTKGLGRSAPNTTSNTTLSNGVVVPLGKVMNTGVNNPGGYTLNYNEYVVYNTNQVKMKYLVKIKFNFK
ncbi:uncharacterized protein TRIADDRAFT_23639, partial [Trichoplax adhaerens]